MTEKTLLIKSRDNIHCLFCRLYIPEGEPKGIFQVVHGMTEHGGRYEEFLRCLCENGYICFIHDNLGHGKSVKDDSELGFIAEKNGYKILVDDCQAVYEAVNELYPNKKHYLLGHSMGSFITRLYLSKYGKTLSGYIMMGSGAGNPMADIGLLLTRLIAKLKGSHYISPFMENMAFSCYNKGFTEGEKAWLSSDKSTREKYLKDKYCTFKFTVSAMNDLIRLNKECNTKKWYRSLPKSCPIFIVSGENDPVGEHSKGIKRVYSNLKKQNCYNVNLKLYSGARHEILNDFCREEVIEDIIKFLDNK